MGKIIEKWAIAVMIVLKNIQGGAYFELINSGVAKKKGRINSKNILLVSIYLTIGACLSFKLIVQFIHLKKDYMKPCICEKETYARFHIIPV
jgi:hypothetical protein